MTNLTQISTKWIVSEQNGERLARPCNPFPSMRSLTYVERHAWRMSPFREDHLEWYGKYGKLEYATNHTPGSYKAEELGEVITQWWDSELPFDNPDAVWRDCENTSDIEFRNRMGYITRLYIKAKS